MYRIVFSDWLLKRRTRAERALTTVIATCYLKGVAIRWMNDLVASLGITNLSKSRVSEMTKCLDHMVEDFCTRPLDTGAYLYVLRCVDHESPRRRGARSQPAYCLPPR